MQNAVQGFANNTVLIDTLPYKDAIHEYRLIKKDVTPKDVSDLIQEVF
jgi:hypothetical protein